MNRKHDLAQLRDKLRHLPESPGVYLMKDQAGRVIYVGKAKQLKNRVRSYFFNPDQHDPKTRKLVSEISSFDIIKTNTEVEALLTERSLIRHHSPRFNVIFRDDKEYPYLRVDFNEPWPRIEKVRRRKDDGAFYLGPFGRAGQLQALLKSVHRIFPLIKCSRYEFRHAKRPCNYYHMKMCLAPCALEVERQHYLATVNHALQLLQGKNKHAREELTNAMAKAAQGEQYEIAASYRDQLASIAQLSEKQTVIVQDIEHADVIASASDDDRIAMHVLTIRDGSLVASESFTLDLGVESEEGAIATFLLFYYDKNPVPSEIIVAALPNDHEQMREIFADPSTSYQPKFDLGSSDSRQELLQLAQKNARYQLQEATRERSQRTTSLKLVKERLQLAELPRRIECIDISHLQGEAIMASCVCFIDGIPAKHEYRTFSIKSVAGKSDDYQSIREVVQRRMQRGFADDNLPNLLVIDGGRGQLNAALEGAASFQPHDVIFIGLAKSRRLRGKKRSHHDQDRSFERVFTPHQEDPLILQPGSAEFRLLTHIRDEAHRFAVHQHRRKRQKPALASELDGVPGVGPALKKRLLEYFGSLKQIKAASLEQLTIIPGLPEKTAIAIYNWSHHQDHSDTPAAQDLE